MWGNLPTYYNDNSDLENKIKNKYFDYIIYGSIRRDSDFLDIVKEHYPKNKICFIEGEDTPNLLDTDGIVLFKRELTVEPNKCLQPISFGIPEEKIVKDTSGIVKTRDIAEYIPGAPSYIFDKPLLGNISYIYNTEEEYYNNYRIAKFGITRKKSGWDCMRHYEILGNYCIPFFENLEECPAYTMMNLPKQTIIDINKKFLSNTMTNSEYNDALNFLFNYTKTNLTTTAIVRNILDYLIKNS